MTSSDLVLSERVGCRAPVNSTSKKLIKWALILGAWTVLAFFFTTQALIQDPRLIAPHLWWRVAVWEFFFCLIWFALTPAAIWLGERLPIVRSQLFKNLTIYILASLFFSLLHLVFFTAGIAVLPQYPGGLPASTFKFVEAYPVFVAAYLHFCLLSFWGLVLVDYLIRYYQAYQERALRAAQLEATLTQSRLQLLKSQLQPHFLFNTLNTISELVHENGELAERMISRLSSLLRMSLESDKAQEVPLDQELNFLKKYLDIEKARFEERLNISFEISSETLDAQVPNMILQPLVENAVRYSIAPRAKGGRIRIVSLVEDSKLQIRVEDDGEGHLSEESLHLSKGIGLSNTEARLQALYGMDHRFELLKAEPNGLIIKIVIPFRTDKHTNEGGH